MDEAWAVAGEGRARRGGPLLGDSVYAPDEERLDSWVSSPTDDRLRSFVEFYAGQSEAERRVLRDRLTCEDYYPLLT